MTTDDKLMQRYGELDDMMKIWFRQETMIKAWNINADRRMKKAREFNAQKKWYQRRKPEYFPHYTATPVRMPILIPVPPSWHPQYEEAKKLIQDYIEEL